MRSQVEAELRLNHLILSNMIDFVIGLIILVIWVIALIIITPFAIIALFTYGVWALITLIIDIIHEFVR